MEDIERRQLQVVISAQVISEVSGVLYHSFGMNDTTRYVEAILSYPMEAIPVTTEIVRMSAAYSRDYNILPYDGIHVATAISLNVETILSADKEFEKVKILKRMDPLSYERAALQ